MQTNSDPVVKKSLTTQHPQTLQIMIEAFIEDCDPKFSWTFSEPYRYGDHPDTGGGVIQKDPLNCRLDKAGDMTRRQCVETFGAWFICKIEDYAFDNEIDRAKQETEE